MPLCLLLRPYRGVTQDARLYIGRGVADRDPAGVGRDTVFLHDGQNGFSVMRHAVDALLGLLAPGSTSVLLVVLGLAAWVGAAAALALRLERGRAAWAIVVVVLALPPAYGGFGTFSYAEAVATPRIFAEAAVLAGFAALLGGRRRLALALLAAAAACHPLMAAPGIAVAAVLLLGEDRRWRWLVAAAGAAVIAGALLGAPFLDRLLVPMDPAWAAVLRHRSVNLFPSLWPATAYLDTARRLATVILAASLLAGPARRLMLAGAGAALAGLGAAALLGDARMMELVTQLQPWRALWLLAVLGNAGVAICAVRLWRGTDLDRLALAALACMWLTVDIPAVEAAAMAAALGLRAASLRASSRVQLRVPPRVLTGAALLVAVSAFFGVAQGVAVATVLVRAARLQAVDSPWRYAFDADLLAILVSGSALALACAPESVSRLPQIPSGLCRLSATRRRAVLVTCAASFAGACFLTFFVWSGTSAEEAAPLDVAAVAALSGAIGSQPGEVMWIDEDAENWFLAGRPAFFNALQGGPILFSRALALDWASRAALVRDLGWARESDVAPWATPDRRLDRIMLSPETVLRFCRDFRRPAAVVAPGDQTGAVPRGWTARLWRPAAPFRRPWSDAGSVRWTTWDVFTVVRCPAPPDGDGRSGGRDDGRSGDGRSFG